MPFMFVGVYGAWKGEKKNQKSFFPICQIGIRYKINAPRAYTTLVSDTRLERVGNLQGRGNYHYLTRAPKL